jgi:hypothetical protein
LKLILRIKRIYGKIIFQARAIKDNILGWFGSEFCTYVPGEAVEENNLIPNIQMHLGASPNTQSEIHMYLLRSDIFIAWFQSFTWHGTKQWSGTVLPVFGTVACDSNFYTEWYRSVVIYYQYVVPGGQSFPHCKVPGSGQAFPQHGTRKQYGT